MHSQLVAHISKATICGNVFIDLHAPRHRCPPECKEHGHTLAHTCITHNAWWSWLVLNSIEWSTLHCTALSIIAVHCKFNGAGSIIAALRSQSMSWFETYSANGCMCLELWTFSARGSRSALQRHFLRTSNPAVLRETRCPNSKDDALARTLRIKTFQEMHRVAIDYDFMISCKPKVCFARTLELSCRKRTSLFSPHIANRRSLLFGDEIFFL